VNDLLSMRQKGSSTLTKGKLMGNLQEKLSEQELAEAYNDWLNENYGSFEIGECVLWSSDILKSTDPIAYRVGLNDYADMLLEEGYEIEGY
jgi:hypothetical protein